MNRHEFSKRIYVTRAPLLGTCGRISSVEYKRTLEAMPDSWARLAADWKAQVIPGNGTAAGVEIERPTS